AADVGAPVDRLLKQIVEAGLKARRENDAVTSDEKQQLLAYLRKTHGAAQAEPNKITLKRKTTTTLKGGKAKTVNGEVRKRRTYTKRAELQPEPEKAATKPGEEAEQPVAEQQAPEQAPKVTAEQAQPETSAAAPAPEQEQPAAEPKKAQEPEPAPEDIPMPPPEDEGRDRKPKKKKEKVRERGDEIEEGKPKKKQAGHRGPRSRPVEEPLVISEDDDENRPRKQLRAKKKPKEKRHAFEW